MQQRLYYMHLKFLELNVLVKYVIFREFETHIKCDEQFVILDGVYFRKVL